MPIATEAAPDTLLTADELLTVEEVCQWLKVDKSWVYERVRARKGLKLPHIKMGHYLRFERTAIHEFLKQHRKSYSTFGTSELE